MHDYPNLINRVHSKKCRSNLNVIMRNSIIYFFFFHTGRTKVHQTTYSKYKNDKSDRHVFTYVFTRQRARE